MNEKASSALQKAQQERKHAQFPKAIKRLEQAVAAFPDELDLLIELIDVCLDAGEIMQATRHLKTAQDKFTKEKDRVNQFVRDKLQAIHDPSLARCVVEHAVKRRDMEAALVHLMDVPEHVVRELLNRSKTKKQSLKSASHGGYSLRGETVTNELLTALLAIRLGQMKEAMETLVKVLTEKPVEYQMIDPLLADLESKNGKNGRVRYARGCSLQAAGLEADAIARFVEAARLEPTCASVSADHLKAMREGAKHPDKIEHGLAEVLLVKGDMDEAATVLRAYLKDHPDVGREIIMLLKPFIEPAAGINACTWVSVEAALGLDQSSAALDILRPLHQRGEHGPEIFEWLESRLKDGFLPPDVMLFHGSLAVEQKLFERAAEILGAVCSTSPQNVDAVLDVLEVNRSAHASLGDLYTKYAKPKEEEPAAEATAAPAGEADFQMFDNKEFHLETTERFTPPARAPQAPAAPGFQKPVSPFGQQGLPKKTLMDNAELSLDDLAADAPPETPPDASAGTRPVISSGRGSEISESHAVNVGRKLYEAGAAAFFHVDEEAPDSSAATVDLSPTSDPPEPAPAGATPRTDEIGIEIAPPSATIDLEPSAPAPAPPPAAGDAGAPTSDAAGLPAFDAEYARFQHGELDNPAIIALIERAIADHRIDEIYQLLCFEPQNDAERFARRFHHAEYLALRNRPLQALEALNELDGQTLSDEQRHRVWYRTAVCQRSVQDYAAARETLDRLVKARPDVADYDRLAQHNYEQYLADQCRETTVLEKTTSLE